MLRDSITEGFVYLFLYLVLVFGGCHVSMSLRLHPKNVFSDCNSINIININIIKSKMIPN